MKHRPLCLLFALVTTAALAGSYDWPQWQGPDRDSASKEHGLLQQWPAGGPPLAWKISGLGGGYSGPSIAAGRIFGMSDRGDDESVWALSESDGKTLWVTPIAAAFKQSWPQGKEGPGCTPTVDGDIVYAIGLQGDLACLQAKDGKIIWQTSLHRDFGGPIPTWSFRESPLIDGNKLICTPGGPDATMVALDKLTGKVLWKCQAPGSPGASYASAIAIDFDGQREYLQVTSKSLLGVSADGKFLWQYDRCANKNGINCTSPLFQDGFVFGSSAYGAGGGLVKLGKDANGGVSADEVYFSKKMENHHGGLILLDGVLYGANGGNGGGALICLDFKTGKVLWDEHNDPEKRAPKGSIVLADNRLYYRTEKGTVLLIEPSSSQYVERGRFDQPDRTDSPAWTHPVVANGKLYIRDQDVLFCYNVKAEGT